MSQIRHSPDSLVSIHHSQLELLSNIQRNESSLEGRVKARRMSIENRELLIAVSKSNLEEMERLIKEGVDINFKDRDGNTPLHWAVESGDLKVVKLLVDKGVIVTIKNNKDETPIDLAQCINRLDIIQILHPEPPIQPEHEKLLDKQLEHNTGQNINQLSRQQKQVNAIHGNIYQLKILMLFLHRGVSLKYSFRLGTEIKEAKKFDDLVFEYTQGDKKIFRLLQAKHKLDESKKITAYSLLTESNGDYNLIKYFSSYQASKEKELFNGGVIKDVTVCTNIDFDFENLEVNQIRVETIKDEDDIINLKSDKKQPTRYRFSQDIAPKLEQKIQESVRMGEIKDFLNHLVFAVNQPNEEELGMIIKEEIRKEFDFITTENIYNKLFFTMLNWLQGKERGMFFSYEEGKEFFEEARRGIPIYFDVRDPVDTFIGRREQLDKIHRIFQDQDKNAISQVISISGLGGVGKSELARMYIYKYSKYYDNKIVWINAENYQNLVKSFRRLACDTLRNSTKNANGKEKEITSIVEDVYKYLSIGKSLFVFDNAEKYKCQHEFDNGIDKFLPSLPLDCNKPYILITSRNQKWPKDIKVLQLDALNEKEAVEFIKKSLNIINDAQENDIKELSKKLQFFPLALQQAVAYIRVQDEKLKNLESEFTISKYLERYREKTSELLNYEFPEDSSNDYTKTILTTWNVTLDGIRQKESGNDALDILNIISYLVPENIPIKIFLSLVSDEEKLGSAIELLKQYSMVNSENGMLNVHRLVQQATIIKLRGQNKEEEILTKALKLFNKDNVDSKNVDHAISVWNYSNKYSELVTEFCKLTSYISCELIDNARYEEAHLFGSKVLELLSAFPSDNPSVIVGISIAKNNIAGVLLKQGKYDTALKSFQNVFNIQKTFIGPDHPETLNVKKNIALTLFKQGKYNEALKYYQEILVISNIILGESHPDTLATKHDIAGILICQSSYDEALQMLREIHDIQEATLGEKHPQTLNTKNSIAGALTNQCKYNEALQMLQKIQIIQEATLTINHPNILCTKKNIARILSMQGKYSDALRVYQKVLNEEKVVFGENHPDVLCIYRQVAEILRMQGKYDKALEIFQWVFYKQIDTLGIYHPDVLYTQYSKALTLDNKSKYTDALQIYQEVLSKQKAILGNDHSETLKVKNCIAVIFAKQGENDKALQHYQEILKIQKSRFGENHSDTLTTKNNIGMSLYNKKEYDKALHIFQEVFSMFQTILPGHPDTLSAKNNIALVLSSQKKHDEALKTFREVLASQEAILGEEHYSTTRTRYNIAETLLAKGRHNEALRVYQEVFKGFNKVLGPGHEETLRIGKTIQSVDLLIAVKSNTFEKIEYLIKNGGDVNTKDDDDITLLHYAVNNGNIDIVNILLKNGADVTQITNKGNTPLYIATSKGHKEIVEILLQHVSRDKLNDFINAKTNSDGTTSLHVAAKNGFLEIVKSLLEHGATYDIENKESKIPIDLSKDQDVINLLKLVTELFENARKGNVEIISKLRAVKIDEFLAVTNACNNQRNTLLQVVRLNKHMNIASKLVEILKKLDLNLQG